MRLLYIAWAACRFVFETRGSPLNKFSSSMSIALWRPNILLDFHKFWQTNLTIRKLLINIQNFIPGEMSIVLLRESVVWLVVCSICSSNITISVDFTVTKTFRCVFDFKATWLELNQCKLLVISKSVLSLPSCSSLWVYSISSGCRLVVNIATGDEWYGAFFLPDTEILKKSVLWLQFQVVCQWNGVRRSNTTPVLLWCQEGKVEELICQVVVEFIFRYVFLQCTALDRGFATSKKWAI